MEREEKRPGVFAIGHDCEVIWLRSGNRLAEKLFRSFETHRKVGLRF
jgi:hypothetical protein